ncbi:Putative ribosome biogenesis GTPase RsgA [Marinomonas spartinae]|uniref:Putative ribosome biogenesis GTPase RsgA n=1 Tax=Marinomonas spartinae TaxID=1792290 RepID=A0A1A8TQA2_9GAMM|nr:GTPase RsgA [Marinomonas spartinae]SBS35293.1 Putative ribosome biogenesis GTPase RsgA [Marinomonas spartinae]SBS39433.1 Putative ribosome biogenesis GTPase RsgA [Marinomonas spartinae]
MDTTFTLLTLGWQPYFQQQLSLDDLESNQIARICSCQTNHYELIGESGLLQLDRHDDLPEMVIGDWVITDANGNFLRRLDRSSFFEDNAANVDTVFIVSPLDQDINLPLIKRYLELTHEAQADAVVVLTKVDACDDASEKRALIERLDPLLIVETVNALDTDSLSCLAPALKKGKTIALLGGEGAGKSALINTLKSVQNETSSAEIGASKALQTLPHGAILLDTQGLRDLQTAQYNSSKIESYADILALAEECRFSDCHHQGEPGCAIAKAVKEKRLDESRVANFMLMLSEDNDDDSFSKSKPQGKFYRSAQSDIRARKHSAAE